MSQGGTLASLARNVERIPRFVVRELRRAISLVVAKLWKLAWALFTLIPYVVVTSMAHRSQSLAIAQASARFLDRLPVFLPHISRLYVDILEQRGHISDAAAAALKLARLKPDSETVNYANRVWSEFIQTEPQWTAFATLPKLPHIDCHAVVISDSGEDLFADLFTQAHCTYQAFSSERLTPDPVVLAETYLDRVTQRVCNSLSARPTLVIAAPAHLMDYRCVVVARSIAEAAEARFIIRLPISQSKPEFNEMAQRCHQQLLRDMSIAKVVTADNQLLKEILGGES